MLKSFCKSDCQYHGHNADGSSCNSKPDNKPGKGMLTVKCDTPGNKSGKVQTKIFNTQK
jgi:hypothetical protein